MSISAQDIATLTAREWLHVFEEDAPGVEVYRPRTHPVPPSRRPRERLCCHSDGSAEVGVGGPDDRSRQLDATWEAIGDEVLVTVADGSAARSVYRIVTIEPDRLLVRP